MRSCKSFLNGPSTSLTIFRRRPLKLERMNTAGLIFRSAIYFALKASLVRDMLEVKDSDYETASSKKELKTVDIFDKAKKFTVLMECMQ